MESVTPRPATALDSNSRQTYTAAAERLNELAGAGAQSASLAVVGDEILAVAELLTHQPRLRRALSDPSRTGEERAELLAALLDGKVADGTQTLLRVLVAGYWPSAHELLTSVERLGIEALLASADAGGELAEVEDELFRFGQVVDGNSALAANLGTVTTPVEQRAALVQDLLGEKAKPITIRLVDVALHGFGGRTFAGSLSRLVELSAERRDRQIAYVTVASMLSDDEENRLGARLAQLYGRPVAIKVSVEPGILGGVRVRVGSDLYDGTVLRRLTDTRTALAGSSSASPGRSASAGKH